MKGLVIVQLVVLLMACILLIGSFVLFLVGGYPKPLPTVLSLLASGLGFSSFFIGKYTKL